MKTINLLTFKGYPMYQKIKCTNKGLDKDKMQTFGDSIINIVVSDLLEVGDLLNFGTERHKVTEITEQRKARGHHPIEATFQQVKCSYINQLPQ